MGEKKPFIEHRKISRYVAKHIAHQTKNIKANQIMTILRYFMKLFCQDLENGDIIIQGIGKFKLLRMKSVRLILNKKIKTYIYENLIYE